MASDSESELSGKPKHRDFHLKRARPRAPDAPDAPDAELAALARGVLAACSGTACFFGYRFQLDQGLVRIGLSNDAARRLWARLNALFAPRRERPRFAGELTISLAGADLASLTGLTGEISLGSRLVAALSSELSNEVVAALIAPSERREREIEAAAKVAGRTALLILKGHQYAEANELWRERARTASEDLARERQSSLTLRRERERLENALAALKKLPRSRRFRGLGEVAASLAACEAWALAVDEGDGLNWKASFGLRPLPALGSASALRFSFERGVTVSRVARRLGTLSSAAKTGAKRREGASDTAASAAALKANDCGCEEIFARGSRACAEDSLMREHGLGGYVVLPFERGALMLARSRPLQPVAVRRLQDFVAAAHPVIGAWLREDELERYRGLVRKLGARLLNAADHERARIARDLHDDQAQLVASLKLALSAPREKARKLLAEIERELRARITALRPVALRGISLECAIEREFSRLDAAGVKGKLVLAVAERALSKPIAQVCFQVVREALANVARHAAATEVVVMLARRNNTLRLEVTNDDVNPRHSLSGKGAGLTGLNERLKLLGGRCRFTVDGRKSALVADIPLIGR